MTLPLSCWNQHRELAVITVLGWSGYLKDASTGERLGYLGDLHDYGDLDARALTGEVEQETWGGYPTTFTGPAAAFASWIEAPKESNFRQRLVRAEQSSEHPGGVRTATPREAKKIATDTLRSVDPERRIRVDLWDQS